MEKHLTEGRKEYQGQATQGLTTHFSPSRESAYTIALDLKTFLPYPLPGEGMSSGKPQTPESATARALGPGLWEARALCGILQVKRSLVCLELMLITHVPRAGCLDLQHLSCACLSASLLTDCLSVLCFV